MRYYYTLKRMTKTKKTDSVKCWWESGVIESLKHCLWVYKLIKTTLESQKKPHTKGHQCIILFHGVQKKNNTNFYVGSQGSD